MNDLLQTILDTQVVKTPDGREDLLHSSVDRREVHFLLKLIKDFNAKKTLEVGCAMGISSLAICDGITKNGPDSFHTIIDPFQGSDWRNIGITNLAKAGFSNFKLLEEGSEYVLPRLAQSGIKYDFAFIDGFHTFDHTVIDFFYINRLLKVGGVVAIDDVQMPAVNKVARMISTYPSYRQVGQVQVSPTKGQKALRLVQSLARPLTRLAGKRLSEGIFSSSILHSDKSLGLNSSIVVFEKTAEDNRPWNWFSAF